MAEEEKKKVKQAVAIEYDPNDLAPKIVATGRGKIAERIIEQAKENLRLNRDFYQAGTTTMSDLLEAQLLYQQALDKRTDTYTDYQNKLLAYRQAVGE